jgi:FKBP-type peptidyl-prolyl cis-trans isomerase
MHAGEKARAVIPSHLAYGISGNGQIPAAAFLMCEIEIIKVYK